MRETDLPGPGIGPTGFALRRSVVKAISELQTSAPRFSTGTHPAAAALKAFFDAASAAVTSLATAQLADPEVRQNPSVSGNKVVGQVLTGTTGSWEGALAPTYAYAWFRGDTQNGTFTAIAGATSATYTLVAGDAGKYLRYRLTATNASGSKTIVVPVGLIAAA